MTVQRVYLVAIHSNSTDETIRLVRAPHSARVARHVMPHLMSIQVASQDDLIRCVKAGIEVENVSAESEADSDADTDAEGDAESSSSAVAADAEDSGESAVDVPAAPTRSRRASRSSASHATR